MRNNLTSQSTRLQQSSTATSALWVLRAPGGQESDDSGGAFKGSIVCLCEQFGYLASLKFMWDARSNQGE